MKVTNQQIIQRLKHQLKSSQGKLKLATKTRQIELLKASIAKRKEAIKVLENSLENKGAFKTERELKITTQR